jgi:hypothetical protein
MRTPTNFNIARDILPQNMTLVYENEVPQSLLTQRPVPTLEVWIGVRCGTAGLN